MLTQQPFESLLFNLFARASPSKNENKLYSRHTHLQVDIQTLLCWPTYTHSPSYSLIRPCVYKWIYTHVYKNVDVSTYSHAPIYGHMCHSPYIYIYAYLCFSAFLSKYLFVRACAFVPKGLKDDHAHALTFLFKYKSCYATSISPLFCQAWLRKSYRV